MTTEEKELLYRILFEDSDEEPTEAAYEVYGTLSDLVDILEKNPSLPQISRTLH